MHYFKRLPNLPRAMGTTPGPVRPASWNTMVDAIQVLEKRINVLVPASSADIGHRVTPGGVTSWIKRWRKGGKRGGRFIVTFGQDEQRIDVSDGCVVTIDLNALDGSEPILPERPTINAVELGEPNAFFLIEDEGLVAGTEYQVQLLMKRDFTPEIRIKDPNEEPASGGGAGPDPEGEASFTIVVLATFTLKAGPGGEGAPPLVLDGEIDQLWESDFPFYHNDPSSSGSSDSIPSDSSGSSTPSSGGSDPGSEKSTAVVPASWTPGGYVALAAMEADQVLFEFVLRDIPIHGRITRVEIDPRMVEVCEPGSITVASAPCSTTAHAVGAEVEHGNRLCLIVARRKEARPKHVTVRLTGIRKGFANWQFEPRTRAEFEANERRILNGR